MEDNRPRYRGICPICGAELWICRSIGMELGWMNDGSGSCHKCNTFLHLIFKPEEKEFDVEAWEDFMRRDQGCHASQSQNTEK